MCTCLRECQGACASRKMSQQVMANMNQSGAVAASNLMQQQGLHAAMQLNTQPGFIFPQQGIYQLPTQQPSSDNATIIGEIWKAAKSTEETFAKKITNNTKQVQGLSTKVNAVTSAHKQRIETHDGLLKVLEKELLSMKYRLLAGEIWDKMMNLDFHRAEHR